MQKDLVISRMLLFAATGADTISELGLDVLDTLPEEAWVALACPFCRR